MDCDKKRADLCASGQQVRALVWEQVDQTAVLGHGIEPCQYYIRYEVGSWWMPGDAEVEDAQEFDDLEAAKAAAQVDYGRRILAALTPAPQAEGQVRVLEVDDLAQIIRVVDGNNTLGAGELAEAIKQACDLLAERSYGSPARSPAHNARLVLEAALDHATPTAQEAVPVAWMLRDMEGVICAFTTKLTSYDAENWEPLYAQCPPQPAGEAVLVSQDALIDLIGEFGREVYYMLDDCETSGPVGEEVHTITDESLTKVSAILDRIDALPFEEPGVILGTGAMLQAAIKQTFQTHPPQPSETVAEALKPFANMINHIETDTPDDYHPSWAEFLTVGDFRRAAAALRALKGGDANG